MSYVQQGKCTPKFCKLQELLFHMHNLVHSLPVDFKHQDIDIKLSMCLHFRFFQKVCLRQQENALLQKGFWLVA